MPNFDITEGRMQCLIMTAAQKEQGHLANEQKSLKREKTSQSEPLEDRELTVRLARGINRA